MSLHEPSRSLKLAYRLIDLAETEREPTQERVAVGEHRLETEALGDSDHLPQVLPTLLLEAEYRLDLARVVQRIEDVAVRLPSEPEAFRGIDARRDPIARAVTDVGPDRKSRNEETRRREVPRGIDQRVEEGRRFVVPLERDEEPAA